jgi:hypothetical protein
MKLPHIFCFLLGTLLFFSCSNEFDVNEEWKEIPIIYGLLDLEDTVQYIKINKAFLSKDKSALEIATIPDSLYHSDSITVTLQGWQSGVLRESILLQIEERNDKNAGVFSNPYQKLYRTPSGFQLKGSYTYKINVENKKSGHVSFSETEIVNQLIYDVPRSNQGILNFATYQNIPIRWSTGKGAKFYDLYLDFYYLEYPSSEPNKIEVKKITWSLLRYRLISNPNISETISLLVNGREFYEMLVSRIPFDADLNRKVLPMKLRYEAGATELYNYIVLNRASLGIVQKKPEYTNIENGYGMFSSRKMDSLVVELSKMSIDTLVSGQYTKHLNFVK